MTTATPKSVTMVEKHMKIPNGSPRQIRARRETKTGYELQITEESPSGMYLREEY